MPTPSRTTAEMPKTPEELESFIEHVIAKNAARDEVAGKTEAVAPANRGSREEQLLRSILVEPALLQRAIEVFGDRAIAIDWLNESNPALDGKAPVDVYPQERDELLRILGRIEHGVIS